MPGWTQGHLPFLDLWYKLSRLLSACPPGHCLAWCPVYVKSKRQDIGIYLFPLNYVWKGSQRSREMDMVRIYKVKWTKDIATLLMQFNKTLLKPGTIQKSGTKLDKTLALMMGTHRLVWEIGRKGDCNTAYERTTASPCLSSSKLSTSLHIIFRQQTTTIGWLILCPHWFPKTVYRSVFLTKL